MNTCSLIDNLLKGRKIYNKENKMAKTGMQVTTGIILLKPKNKEQNEKLKETPQQYCSKQRLKETPQQYCSKQRLKEWNKLTSKQKLERMEIVSYNYLYPKKEDLNDKHI